MATFPYNGQEEPFDWDLQLKDYIDEGDTNTADGSVPVTRTVNGKPLSADVVLTPADVGAQPSDSDLTAIAALSTTAFGRNLLTLADAAAVRAAIGAGTSSLALGTTSTTAKAGDWNPFVGADLGTSDLNTIMTPGLYRQSTFANSTLERNYPVANVNGSLEVKTFTALSTVVVQTFTPHSGTAANASRVKYERNVLSGSTWSEWRRISTQRVVQVAGQPGVEIFTWDDVNNVERQIAPVNTTLGTVDLNTVTVPGSYHQPTAASATLARNYPVANAGYILEVEVSAGNFAVQKIFATTGTGVGRGFWIRRYVLSGAVWTAWAFVPTHRTVQPSGQPGVEVFTWDDISGVERQLAPVNVNLGTTDLNLVLAPGVYRQGNAPDATLAKNYPKASMRGILEVFSPSSTEAIQRFTPMTWTSGAVAAYGYFERRIFGASSFGAWRFVGAMRVDQTAGRAIYQWDDINGREQLIYGDTGWRDVAPLLLNGWSAELIAIRRQGYEMTLAIRALNFSAATSDSFLQVPGFPGGVSGLGNNFIAPLINGQGISWGSGGTFSASRTGSVVSANITQFVRVPVTGTWPTALPGTAIGTIPNL